MNGLVASVFWCWLQALLVALTALGLSRLTIRRSPMVGAAIATSGMVAVLLLLAFAFIPVAMPADHVAFNRFVFGRTQSSANVSAGLKLRETSEADGHPTLGVALSSSLLRDLRASLRGSQQSVERHRRMTRSLSVALVIGTVCGLLRLILTYAALVRMSRRATPVSNPIAGELLSDLLPLLHLRHIPEIRQTTELSSAAVVGSLCPVILLPETWREWSSRELKAVLAHELAHISRRDAFWRLVAAASVSLYWAQPLVHGLRKQLLLAQEMAADELAAQAMGSKQAYLRALAKLALRDDGGRESRAAQAALLPVFSGFLLRRIAMLRAKDGSLSKRWRMLTQGAAIALVAVAALFGAAIRGLAEPPERQADGSVRVARGTSENTARPDVEAGMFRRPVLDISKYAPSDKGGFLVRVGEICQQPRFAPFVPQCDQWLSKTWKDLYPDADAPPFSLSEIDYVVGDFVFTARYAPSKQVEHDPHPHQLMAGTECGFVRWRKPVEEIFAWLKRTPGAEVKQHRDFVYVTTPLAMLGPHNSCFCCFDDHTLLWAAGEAALHSRLDHLATGAEKPTWERAWKEADGGLVTVVSAVAEYKDAPHEHVDEAEQITQEVFAKTRLKTFVADWLPAQGGHVSCRFQAGVDTEDDARLIEQHLRRALQKMREDTAGEDNPPPSETSEAAEKALVDFLAHPSIETQPAEQGRRIQVRFSGSLPLESLP